MNELDLFAAAIAISERPERDAFLDRECADRPELRQRLKLLLDQHDQSHRLLDRPNGADRDAATALMEAQSLVGTVIDGRYKLLKPIGDGGMGTVWMAEQREPVKRLVAIKLIKAGMDSKSVMARFEAERQALAMMDHPNIAKVHDAGTDDGRPYFVMELVKGLPLTEYCDARRLSINNRLDLFVQICSAVQHAHQKAVIHRDLKPSNILVTEHDGKPVPKVIDFGLAKALGTTSVLTERTLHTAYGTVVGTPLYMAPEQVGINALDVDTRTDIYALGVILYELLAGSTPLEKGRFKEAAWDEVKRLIRDVEPQRPSLRLSSDKTLASLAASRQVEPSQLPRMIRGDLDWIVMKALDKDRSRRFETANGLARDVQRYLSGDAVEACPPTLGYRLRKVYRRNRGAVLTAASFAAVLLVATGISVWFGIQSNKDKRLAIRNAERAEMAEQESRESELAANEALLALEQRDHAHTIQLADAALRDYRLSDARVLLDAVPRELRGWEWKYLNRLSQSEHLFELQRPDEAGTRIFFATYSPDSTNFVTVSRGTIQRSEDGSRELHWTADVQVWDAESGREWFTLCHDVPNIRSAAYSPVEDGRILTVQRDAVIVWDLATRTELFRLVPDPDFVFAGATFSPDGARIATKWRIQSGPAAEPSKGGNEQPDGIRIWDAATGELIVKMQGSRDGASELAFTPDGKWLVSHQRDARERTSESNRFEFSVKIWNAETGENLLTAFADDDDPERIVTYSRLSPDGSRLAVRRRNGVEIWPLTSDEGRPVLGAHPVTLLDDSMAASQGIAGFSPDGRQVLLVSDRIATIRDCDRGTQLRVLAGHSGPVSNAVWSPNGQRILTTDAQGTTRIWKGQLPAQPSSIIESQHFPFSDASFNRKGNWIMTISPADNGAAAIWDAHSRELISETRFPMKNPIPMTNPSFSPDGRWIVSVSGNVAHLYDTSIDKEVGQFQGHTDTLHFPSFNPEGTLLALSNNDWTVSVWDVAERTELFRIGEPEPSGGWTRACFTPDGKGILVEHLTRDFWTLGALRLHDVRTGDVVQELEIKTETKTLTFSSSTGAFSPDGTRYVGYFKSSDRSADGFRVWDVATGRELFRFHGHWDTVTSVAFSPKGERIVTASEDRTVKIWLAASGIELLSLNCEPHPSSARFSPDGTKLIAACGVEVRIWDAAPVDAAERR